MNLLYFILAIYFINFFFGLKLLLKFNYNYSNTYYVLLLCIMFPFLTPVVYLVAYFDDNTRTILIKKQGLDINNIHEVNNTAVLDKNDVSYYINGKTFVQDLFSEIEKAEKFIHISFFTVQSDKLGKELFSYLEKKLQQGIDVKILYDPIGSFKLKERHYKRFKELGGEIIPFPKIVYRPFLLNINYRNHRKYIVIDNKISYLGGFNIGDKYVSRDKKMGFWFDCELKIVGESTSIIEKRFLADYIYCTKKVIDKSKYLIHYDFKPNIPIQIISSGVDVNYINQIEHSLMEYIYNAKDYIYIQTPYLILTDAMIKALKYASFKGVEIRIMIPNKNDHPFVLQASKAYARVLLDDHIKVYLYDKDAFMHAKVFVCDDKIVSIGTSNFDIRSYKYCLEINAYVYNQSFTQKLRDMYHEQIPYCSELTLSTIKNQSHFKKLTEDLCKLLSTIL